MVEGRKARTRFYVKALGEAPATWEAGKQTHRGLWDHHTFHCTCKQGHLLLSAVLGRPVGASFPTAPGRSRHGEAIAPSEMCSHPSPSPSMTSRVHRTLVYKGPGMQSHWGCTAAQLCEGWGGRCLCFTQSRGRLDLRSCRTRTRQTSDVTKAHTGAQPVTPLANHRVQLPFKDVSTGFARITTSIAKDLPTRPSGGRRWPASETRGVMGLRGTGVRTQGRRHPLLPTPLKVMTRLHTRRNLLLPVPGALTVM